jgi:hypothetical protein
MELSSPVPKNYRGRFPFKLSTTPYIYPDEIVPNVARLAPSFDEIDLVLFESRSLDSIPDQMKRYGDGIEVILLDCLTLWLTNLLLKGDDNLKMMEETERLVRTLRERRTSVIIVSNEVGMGIVPVDPLSRRFRDLSGMK